MTETVYDIIVIGAGVVGATLVSALEGQSLRVAVVDTADLSAKLSAPREDRRAFALSYASAKIFSTLNIWPDIAASTTPIRHIHVSDKGHFGATRFSAKEMGVDALGHVVPASTLLNAVRHRLQKNKTVACYERHRVVGLTLGDVCHSVVLESETGRHTLHGKLIVAADGSDSVVRQQLGLRIKQHTYHESAVVTDIKVSEQGDTAYERFTPTGPLALLPLSDQHYGLVWTLPQQEAAEKQKLDDHIFLAQLQKQFGYRLGYFEAVGRRQVFPLVSMHLSEAAPQGVVLVGNAAHTLHPIAAQGLNLGLRDVAVLAECIVDAVHQKTALRDLGLLRAYEAERKCDQRRVRTFSELLVQVFSVNMFPVPCARDIGLVGFDLSRIGNRLLAEQAMGRLGHLPKLACGIALSAP